MHIAFLTPEYPHEKFGPSAGLGASIKNLAYSLKENDISVTVFVHSQEVDNIFELDGINFIGIQKKRYPFLGWYLYRKYLQNRINEAIKDKNIDLIEAPDWTGITAFMKFDTPLILRIHGSDAYFCHLEGRKQKFKNRLFEKRALKNADYVISVSEFAAKVTKEVFGIDREIKIIPNGVSLKNFNSEAKPGITENRILYFGTIIRKKGVLELAEIFNYAIEKNPNIELLLIGKDVFDIRENVSTINLFTHKLTQKALGAVKFISEVPYIMIKEYINSAAVVVLPSFAEAFPMTWLEAMAMEKPLVTSNIGWASEIMVDEVTGYTVSPFKHRKFADRMLDLFNNPEKAAKMGEAARKRIEENFSTEVVSKKNIAFYNKVLGHKS